MFHDPDQVGDPALRPATWSGDAVRLCLRRGVTPRHLWSGTGISISPGGSAGIGVGLLRGI